MKTFEECAKDGNGTVYHDAIEDGIRYLVMRGPCSLCAYLGIPLDHPLAGKGYDIPLDVHGGLTFAGKGDGKYWSEDRYWYGWDYGHLGDKSFYYRSPLDVHAWTPDEVLVEVRWALFGFIKLMRLVEGK